MGVRPPGWGGAARSGGVPPVERSRGTLVAVGFSATACLVALLWFRRYGLHVRLSPFELACLLLVPALAGRITFVLAPRGAWTPSAPLAVAVGLVAGPLVGVCAGAATQLLIVGSVWRYRLAWGGVFALEGFGGGLAGQLRWPGGAGAVIRAGVAVLLFLAVNQVANVFVALERRIEPRRPHLRLGLAVDLTESCLLFSLLVPFVVAAGTNTLLALGALAVALTILALADHARRRILDELAEERSRARRDPLTAAPNRLALDEALSSEHARVVRGTQPAGLLFLDVDHFRTVNHDHGYQVGDTLLVAVYERLRKQLRPSDLICRWGGEEFVILAPELGREQAVADFAERVRRLVSNKPLLAGSQTLAVTVSVGATLLDGTAEPTHVLDHSSRLARIAKLSRNTAVTEAMPANRTCLARSAEAG